ncbi:MAG: hypothetical protein IPH65_15865 [Dehalococcoidia bacterium]|uniref:helicase-related protein n=1 Tax=Candidatus Amarobacter glycogenicus TaxID=3140699 RepID=UPI003135D712|nr:hypothetical protein [Dehalococcoidia bacterium]
MRRTLSPTPNRGITVELILAYLKAASQPWPQPQLVGLSAAIGDVNFTSEWLEVGLVHQQSRPVPLVEGAGDRGGVFEHRDASGQNQTKQLLPPDAVVQRTAKPSAQDVVVPTARQLLAARPDLERIIIFRNTRGAAAGAAAYLAADLNLAAAATVLDALPEQDLSAVSHQLRGCLHGGTAFHSSDLSREERAVVERGFRDAQAGIAVLAATTTVAAGINTPASTVIIVETEFKGLDKRALTVAEYKNMAGRAGRLGFAEEGTAILLADNPIDRRRLFQSLRPQQPEPLRSSFNDADLTTLGPQATGSSR